MSTAIRTVAWTELPFVVDATFPDGDHVLSASWGKSRSRALVVEVQRPDGSTGRRYFSDEDVIEILDGMAGDPYTGTAR